MIDELKRRVTEACLLDVIDQLVRDTQFYLSGSAPLPDRSIRSVAVTARRSGSSPSAPAATPVSSSPRP